MQPKHVTIRIWPTTLKLLRLLHAETGVAMVVILHRLIEAEYQRITSGGGKP